MQPIISQHQGKISNQLASELNCPLKNEIEEQLIENKQKRFARLGRRRRR